MPFTDATHAARSVRRVATALAGALLTTSLFACAVPGSRPTAESDQEVVPPNPRPSVAEARCVAAAATLPETATKAPAPSGVSTAPVPLGTGHPMADERVREEMLRRQQAANDAFRQRGTLEPDTAAGARACAAEVLKGLNLLTAGGRDEPDEKAVRRAVTATGLTDVVVRPPGRLDLGPGDGLIFAGWTGRACVFGSVRQDDITVEIGTRIADGGCLPAPD
ncbi:hypothetical protein [Verrucosispora sp. WMMD1129]|uniref:hypothetical protein n=1 Tax=Verrucosispora sp. WMMD1129 TaxID=3016093 RepID=UPI00249BEDA7|nr:hypothetical protein [Verrucosispora sp. WMMD1129]WFE45728.1 hypothetical protein O7624_15905 [Verrucosispora sp. WMMD1129]